MSAGKDADLPYNLEEEQLVELYTWLDLLPLSKPKKNIARDFSDGVLAAEIVKHYCPRLVDLHSYASFSGNEQKMVNWELLNRKVFQKLGFQLGLDDIRGIMNSKPGLAESALWFLRQKLEAHQKRKTRENEQPEADQNTFYNQANKRAPPGKAASKKEMPGADPHKRRGGMEEMRSRLKEKEQEILAKDETIQILQAKIKRLEQLLDFKETRIRDLHLRLESVRPTAKR